MMGHAYTPDNTLALAKRLNNSKRTYLLVNPLQAKHLPVSPGESLEMMSCLGRQTARHYPDARLVIGFAETATAIGAVVAGCIHRDCIYIHTTREESGPSPHWICFHEEHSHAVEQKLWGERMAEWIDRTPRIIFVDDEISTGKTLINIVDQMRRRYPAMRQKEIVAVSVMDRLSEQDIRRLREAGIRSDSLVKLPERDFADLVSGYRVSAARPIEGSAISGDWQTVSFNGRYEHPRRGGEIHRYERHCEAMAEEMSGRLAEALPREAEVLILGTEECMYPALVLGRMLEDRGLARSVRCHATTRSPIGLCPEQGYPIRSGYRLRSFYDEARETFVYNLESYDCAVIVTDAGFHTPEGISDLVWALKRHGCKAVFLAEGGRHV